MSKWGPKHCEGIANLDLDVPVDVFAMYNDEDKDLDNYGVVSIIMYSRGTYEYPCAYAFIQIKCVNGYSISEDEVMFIANCIEVENDFD